MRLKDRVAIVVGAGQSPGEGMGNGRATALTFAREGAKVMCVDHNIESAQETVDMIGVKGGTAVAFKADVTRQTELKAMVADAHSRWGSIDILHNNVGVSIAGGTPSCSTSPRRRSTAVSRSISRAVSSPPST